MDEKFQIIPGILEKEEFTTYLSEIISQVICMSQTDFADSFKDDTIRFAYFHHEEPYIIRFEISTKKIYIGAI